MIGGAISRGVGAAAGRIAKKAAARKPRRRAMATMARGKAQAARRSAGRRGLAGAVGKAAAMQRSRGKARPAVEKDASGMPKKKTISAPARRRAQARRRPGGRYKAGNGVTFTLGGFG